MYKLNQIDSPCKSGVQIKLSPSLKDKYTADEVMMHRSTYPLFPFFGSASCFEGLPDETVPTEPWYADALVTLFASPFALLLRFEPESMFS